MSKYKVEEYNIDQIDLESEECGPTWPYDYQTCMKLQEKKNARGPFDPWSEDLSHDCPVEHCSCVQCGGPVQHNKQKFCSEKCKSAYLNGEDKLKQVGGTHYEDMDIQPFDIVRAWYGDLGLEAALVCKVMKYVGRRKGDRVEDIDKAINCLYRLRDIYTDKEIPF